VNLTYVVFDAAVGVVALRSLAVIGRRAPWTSAGWSATLVAAGAAVAKYAQNGPQSAAFAVAEVAFGVLTACFIVAFVRDEPQAEPLLWPVRLGATRAQRR
jgi:hypothetical protein